MRRQRRADILVNQGREVGVVIARHHGGDFRRAQNGLAARLDLQRVSDYGARGPGDQIAVGEGVVEFEQRARIRNGEAVIGAAIDDFLGCDQWLPIGRLLVLSGARGILGDGSAEWLPARH